MKSTVNTNTRTRSEINVFLPFATLIRLIRFYLSLFLSLSLALLLILLCRVPVNVGVILHILPLRSTNTFGGFYLFTAVLCFVWVLLRFAFDCIISLCVRSFHFGLVWYACANFVCVNGTLFSDLKRRTAPISSKISKISDIVCMHV